MRLAQLITGDCQIIKDVPESHRYIGQWLVVFAGPPGLDTDQRFWVDDSTARVFWENDPRSASFLVIAPPLRIVATPLLSLANHVYNAWRYLALPRCPNCGGKLRTRSARQCVSCGSDWHEENRT